MASVSRLDVEVEGRHDVPAAAVTRCGQVGRSRRPCGHADSGRVDRQGHRPL